MRIVRTCQGDHDEEIRRSDVRAPRVGGRVVGQAVNAEQAAAAGAAPTFTKDMAPIFYANCTSLPSAR